MSLLSQQRFAALRGKIRLKELQVLTQQGLANLCARAPCPLSACWQSLARLKTLHMTVTRAHVLTSNSPVSHIFAWYVAPMPSVQVHPLYFFN